jgi:recombination protein RecA
MGDSHVGLQARLMSQALRKLTGSVNRSHCMIFFTNQIRMKIGVMFGSPETTSGGNALKFYASMRLDVRRIGAIKETGPKEVVVVGNRTRVKVVKNKMAPPFREVEFDILYGKGISRSGEVVDMGVDIGVIQKSGAWYSAKGERIGQGRDNARTFLEQHPELMTDIEKQVMIKSGIVEEKPAEPVTLSETKVSAPVGKGVKANGSAKRSARPD